LAFSKDKLEWTSDQINFFRQDWEREVPLKIHAYGVDDGHGLGGPPLHPEFENWLGPICFCGRKPEIDKTGRPIAGTGCPSSSSIFKSKRQYKSDSRTRTTKAFRKLRKVAPREFDAVFMMVAHRASFHTTLRNMNDRAERLGKPRYRPEDMLLLIVSGIDKASSYW